VTTKEELVRRERTQGRGVAVAVGLIVVLTIGSGVTRANVSLPPIKPLAAYLEAINVHHSTLLITGLIQAVAFALLVIPFTFLFRACAARDFTVRRGYIGAVVAAPLFLAVGIVLQQIALNKVASDFVAQLPITPAKHAEDVANNLQTNSTLGQASIGLVFAGVIGFIFATVYTSRRALRVGLMTRFWGTLGIVAGASFGLSVIIAPLAQIGVLILSAWLIQLALIALDRWPGRGTRPPAWAAGEAVPWEPGTGGMPSRGRGRGMWPPRETADDDTVDSDGRPVEENNGRPLSESEVYPPTKPSRPATNPPRQRGERKKRKRRT
jgi:hypothetical protein